MYGLIISPVAVARILPDIPDIEKFLQPPWMIAVMIVTTAITPALEPITKWVTDRVVGTADADEDEDDDDVVRTDSHVLRVGDDGTVVAAATHGASAQLRSPPVKRLPSQGAALLGREAQIQEAAMGVLAGNALEIYGPPGIGKTTLLRALVRHHSVIGKSVVFRSARMQPPADLLQFVFETFYETDGTYKPSDARLREYLQGIEGVIVLDDADSTREELQELADALPACTLVTAAGRQLRAGDATAIPLQGLGAGAALALIERTLARPLAASEVPDASAFAQACGGRPYELVSGASAVAAGLTTFAQLRTPAPLAAPAAVAGPPAGALFASPQERAILATLLAAAGVPVRVEHVSAVTGAPANDLLVGLEQRGLVLSASPSFTVTGDAERHIGPIEVESARRGLFVHFLDEARRGALGRGSPPEDLDVARALFIWGTRQQPTQALEFARHLAPALEVTGRWAAWGEVLGSVGALARASQDEGTEGWALHEQGSHALALGQRDEASALFARAAKMRSAAGDRSGAELSRANFAAVSGTAAAGGRPQLGLHWPGAGSWIVYVWVAAVLIGSTVQIAAGGGPLPIYALELRVDGAGTGDVSSIAGPAINCRTSCTPTAEAGSRMTVRATSATGSFFQGWTGACQGTGPCEIALNANTTLTATFGPTLSLQKSGAGSGVVVSTPAGIDCGSSCVGNFDSGVLVRLMPRAGTNNRFVGWGGACAGTAPSCDVLMNAVKSVTASFAGPPSLTVSLAGAGDGTVTSNPPGISCGKDCQESYAVGQAVVLGAAPTAGSRFVSWSSDCAPNLDGLRTSSTCTTTMSVDRAVTATFQYVTPPTGYAAEPCTDGPPAPIQLDRGKPTNIMVCYRNVGTTTWVRGTGTQVNLAVCCPLNTPSPYNSWAVGWLSQTAYATTAQTAVPPGSITFFSFTVRPPNEVTPGTYTIEGEPVFAATGAPHHTTPTYRQVMTVR